MKSKQLKEILSKWVGTTEDKALRLGVKRDYLRNMLYGSRPVSKFVALKVENIERDNKEVKDDE